MARTSNRRFTTGWLTILSTATALATTREQPGLSRCCHSGQCQCCTEHPDPFHLQVSPSQGNRSFDHPDNLIVRHEHLLRQTIADSLDLRRDWFDLRTTSLLLRITDNLTGVTVDDFESVFRVIEIATISMVPFAVRGTEDVYRRTDFRGLNFQRCLLCKYLRRFEFVL